MSLLVLPQLKVTDSSRWSTTSDRVVCVDEEVAVAVVVMDPEAGVDGASSVVEAVVDVVVNVVNSKADAVVVDLLASRVTAENLLQPINLSLHSIDLMSHRH
jgi:CO dehydrogenase nickel-insertion accessory protein CooC1